MSPCVCVSCSNLAVEQMFAHLADQLAERDKRNADNLAVHLAERDKVLFNQITAKVTAELSTTKVVTSLIGVNIAVQDFGISFNKDLQLNSDWPVNKLFVRNVYTTYWDIIKERICPPSVKQRFPLSFFIGGNPGIGKTCFLCYIILTLLDSRDCDREKVKIFYSNTNENKYFFIDVYSREMWLCTNEGYLLTEVKKEGKLDEERASCYYFFDCSKDCSMNYEIVALCCCVIFVSSPNKSNFSRIKKTLSSVLRELYMPVWSIKEVLSFNNVMGVCIDNLEERFKMYGGCIRSIISDPKISRDALNVALDSANLHDLVNYHDKIPMSHQICKMEPTEDHSFFTFGFMSDYIREQIYARSLKSGVDLVIDVIGKLKRVPMAASVRGSLFEMYSHDRLCNVAHEYKVRNLQNSEEGLFTVSPRGLETYDNTTKIDKDHYYYPANPNEASLDSLIPCLGIACQMTVSKNHPVKYNPLKKMKQRLKCPTLKLYFVVPDDQYASFRKQPYHNNNGSVKKEHVSDIEQWVLCMDVIKFR